MTDFEERHGHPSSSHSCSRTRDQRLAGFFLPRRLRPPNSRRGSRLRLCVRLSLDRAECGRDSRSSGAKILETHARVVTLQFETKYGTQTFRIRRSGERGDYRASFVDRSAGTLTNYTYHIQVTGLEGRRSQVEITMTAFSEDANGVAVNIELQVAAIDANVLGAEPDQGIIDL